MSNNPVVHTPPLGTGQGETARRHVEAGLRGLQEDYLRVLRIRLNTTAPTILQGTGFTLVRNGVGDVTITFDVEYSDIPTVTASTEGVDAAGVTVPEQPAAPTVTTCRVRRVVQSVGPQDGILNVLVVGTIAFS